MCGFELTALCTTCGAPATLPGQRFCAACGAPLRAGPAPARERTIETIAQ